MNAKFVASAAVLALVAGGAWHYRHVIAKNAELTTRLMEALQVADSLETQLEEERRSARIAIEQRQAAQRALDELRRGRVDDQTPEFLEWSVQRIPPTERARICAALPGAAGCE